MVANQEWGNVFETIQSGINIRMQWNPNFFQHLKRFHDEIIYEWFKSITYGDLTRMKKLHEQFGFPLDFKISRNLLQKLLTDKYESLEDANGLIIACITNRIEMIQYLLDNGSNIEFCLPFNCETALFNAMKFNKMESFKVLLKYGANINTTTTQSECYDNTNTPIGFESIILKKGSFLNELCYYGCDLVYSGPKNISGRGNMVNILQCAINEEYGLEYIKSGLNKRYNLIKEYIFELCKIYFPEMIFDFNIIGSMIIEQLNQLNNIEIYYE